MIDLSQLPAPQIIETLDYETIRDQMLAHLAELLPGWTASDLESDPAVKILEVAAYRELLLRQRVNEAARGVMLAFAAGSDLDQLAAFPNVQRLEGAAATFTCLLTISAALSAPVTIPESWEVRDESGECEARLMAAVSIPAGQTSAAGVMEMARPAGAEANGLTVSNWTPIQALPYVVGVTQTSPAAGGSDPESDKDLRTRVQLAPESWSTAGPREAYRYWAMSADELVDDVAVSSPAPGDVAIVVLSAEGDGTADAAMLARVSAAVTAEKRRPLTDHVTVVGAEPLSYAVAAHLYIPSGVAAGPVIAQAEAQLHNYVAEARKIGGSVPLSALIAAAHAPGVHKAELTSPTVDVDADSDEYPQCSGVTVTYEAIL